LKRLANGRPRTVAPQCLSSPKLRGERWAIDKAERDAIVEKLDAVRRYAIRAGLTPAFQMADLDVGLKHFPNDATVGLDNTEPGLIGRVPSAGEQALLDILNQWSQQAAATPEGQPGAHCPQTQAIRRGPRVGALADDVPVAGQASPTCRQSMVAMAAGRMGCEC
jgi:hypothetical protein